LLTREGPGLLISGVNIGNIDRKINFIASSNEKIEFVQDSLNRSETQKFASLDAGI
jgi:hypothetical protein